MSKIIFVTGTDTGVGKTLVTALLLHQLRQSGYRAFAMKPFCSGSFADVRLLLELQEGDLSVKEINPFYFQEPVAPLVAARKHRRRIPLEEVLCRINSVKKNCEYLLIEGSGGVMAPLGEGYAVADLIAALRCFVLVVARNKLGVINHTLLTVGALRKLAIKRIRIVLSNCHEVELSTQTNQEILRELLAPVEVFSLPFLGQKVLSTSTIKKICRKLKKPLALLVDIGNFSPVLSNDERKD